MSHPPDFSGADSELPTAAYGYLIDGVAADGALALRGSASWPRLRLEHQFNDSVGDGVSSSPMIDDQRAVLAVPDGRLLVERSTRLATLLSAREPEPAELVHPYLWPAAAVFARWDGAETLHAGAFSLPGDSGAWVVIGASGGGKSSLLASLAIAGCDVLVDDLVVLDELSCFAGPRCIDLRPEALAGLSLLDDVDVRPVRSTQRRRLPLPPTEGRAVVRGFVQLAWGSEGSCEELRPSESLTTLVEHRRVGVLGANFEQLLELAGLPMLRFSRPRDAETFGAGAAELADRLSGY